MRKYYELQDELYRLNEIEETARILRESLSVKMADLRDRIGDVVCRESKESPYKIELCEAMVYDFIAGNSDHMDTNYFVLEEDRA